MKLYYSTITTGSRLFLYYRNEIKTEIAALIATDKFNNPTSIVMYNILFSLFFSIYKVKTK